ncbi:MAG: amidohydrolase family protein, partial [Candidatus Eisenbacteria bacterium]|nr:amidohydrolase family protein [Candidatus Eisenbacteria bacterium]
MLMHPNLIEGLALGPDGTPHPASIELTRGRIRSVHRGPFAPAGAVAETAPGSRVTGGERGAPEPGSAPGASAAGVERLDADEILLPAFVDAHTHLLGVGTARLKPRLHGATSREETFDRLTSWLAAHPGDEPVIAEGWDQSLWQDRTLPTRADLDRVTTRPVALRRVCGHVAVLNTAA